MALSKSTKNEVLTGPQIRAARALIGWTGQQLSSRSGVSLRTIRRAELSEQYTLMTAPNDRAIRQAFEESGVEFLDENGGGPGVRLKKERTKIRSKKMGRDP